MHASPVTYALSVLVIGRANDRHWQGVCAAEFARHQTVIAVCARSSSLVLRGRGREKERDGDDCEVRNWFFRDAQSTRRCTDVRAVSMIEVAVIFAMIVKLRSGVTLIPIIL